MSLLRARGSFPSRSSRSSVSLGSPQPWPAVRVCDVRHPMITPRRGSLARLGIEVCQMEVSYNRDSKQRAQIFSAQTVRNGAALSGLRERECSNSSTTFLCSYKG